jgi:arylsulfatase A
MRGVTASDAPDASSVVGSTVRLYLDYDRVMRPSPLLVVLVLAARAASAACTSARCPDEAAVEAVRARIALACDCSAATRHPTYVRCARGIVRAAIAAGELSLRCKKVVLRCEKHSTCGRAKAIVCCRRRKGRGARAARIVANAARCGGRVCGAFASTADACTPDGGCAPPNVVIFFVDDMGYGDVGVYGATDIATPHMDRLAAEGMRFTAFTAAPTCTPARAALLTGSYGQRVSVPVSYFPASPEGLNPTEVTIAELLRARGYATGMFGKWHLGDAPAFLPTRQGFDEYFGIPYSNDISPLHPLGPGLFPDLPLLEGERTVELNPDQSQFTRRFTERAVDFIARHAGEPFFLYLAHPMPHVPIFASAAFLGTSGRGLYGDVVSELDWSVGQVLDALRTHGLDRRTLVLFASDNGPWLIMGTHGGSAGPLREGKSTAFEGGVRVAAMARWPGRIPAGRTSAEPVGLIDVLPTVARLAGTAPPDDRVIDGRDIWPILAGERRARSPHEALYVYNGGQLQALRSGRWKLVFPHDYQTVVVPGRDGKFGSAVATPIGLSLFDMETDVGETTNVAGAHPNVVAELLALGEQARTDLGDSLSGRVGSGVRPPGRLP